MTAIREAILVEGRYDKNTLSQVVDTTIIEAGGFGIFHDRETLALLRQAAERRGLILFTDSDGAGFVIRNYLKGALPPDKLLQAYIPEIPGKEKRKKSPGKAGLLGVEGMTPEVILEALRLCGAHFLGELDPRPAGDITRQDLYRWGLTGGTGSKARRDRLKKALQLPAHLGTSAFLEALNLVATRAEVEALLTEGDE